MSDSASHRILRARIAAIEGRTRRHKGRVSLGLSHLDQHLGGGLTLGHWHELVGEGMDEETAAAPAAFAASLAIRLPAACGMIWVQKAGDVYPPALTESGRAPANLICVDARDEATRLSIIEEALATPGLAVIGEVEALSLIAGRRLQLAAERGGGLGLVIRRRLGPRRLSPGSAAAASRWRIGRVSSQVEAGLPGLGAPCWRVTLDHCRGGRPGAWILETCEMDNAAHPFRLVAPLADHGPWTAPAPIRQIAAA